MTADQSTPNLQLLGAAVLLRPSVPALRLERKRAGLLAYLALEGITPRTVLAGLLWPETLESRA